MSEQKSIGKNQIAGMSLSEIRQFLLKERSSLPYGYKLPYMQWYEENFISSSEVREMEPIEEWMYRQLLAKAWVSKNSPYLPNDVEPLKRLSGCRDKKMWDKYSKVVLGMFSKTSDGSEIYHPRQLVDYAVQISKISANIQNGRKGGLKKSDQEIKQSPSDRLPNAHQTPSQLELEPELELKQEQELKSIDSEQGENMKADKQINILSNQMFGKNKTRMYGKNLEEIKQLESIHKGTSVIRAFGEWGLANQGDPDINDAVAAFLKEADDILGGNAPFQKAQTDPEVLSLVRELSYISDNQVVFNDRNKTRLAEILKEFTAEEIAASFKVWFGQLDTSNSKNVDFAGKNFSEVADQLCYSSRRHKQESEAAKIQRDETAKRLQEEAESERREKSEKLKESEIFDPLA